MDASPEYLFEELRALDDEASFFARMGRFFASPTVRRECGGYPLNDGPRYQWFIVSSADGSRVLGFISIEYQADAVRLRQAYLRADARKKGLFRELRRRVLAHIDALDVPAIAQVPESCAARLEPHGFQVQSTRGTWVKLTRSAHATSSRTDKPGGSPVHGTGQPAAGAAH